MALRQGVFRRPVIVASADADLRSHCVVQMTSCIQHVLTVADFRHINIPHFMRQRGILMVDEAQLPAERKLQHAHVSGHGWKRPAMVLARAEVPGIGEFPMLYLTVPIQAAIMMPLFRLVD